MKFQFRKVFKSLIASSVALSPAAAFIPVLVANVDGPLEVKHDILPNYYYDSSAKYSEDSGFTYASPTAPINYPQDTKVDENGWATLDNNDFYHFFINSNVANFFANLSETSPSNQVTLDSLKTLHTNIFTKDNIINLSGFYRKETYGYISLRALTNPYFAWVLKPDDSSDWNKLYLNLSNNNLIEIPDFSQVLAFDESLYNSGKIPYQEGNFLFASGKSNKGQWQGLNLENNCLTNIPFSTLPHLFPRIDSESRYTGIQIDYNYMPYLYHDSRIPENDVDGYRVLPLSSKTNRSSIKYTTMYVESSGITQIIEYLLKVGIYQLDGINYTNKDIYNYLMYGDLKDQTSSLFDQVPSAVSSKNQYMKLYSEVLAGRTNINNFKTDENNFFCIINDYLTSNWLVSQSTKYNSINQFFCNICFSGDVNALWRNFYSQYDMPVQIYPNDAFGLFNVKALYFASKTDYFDHNIISDDDLNSGNLNNIANSIINAFRFNYGNYYVDLNGFKIDSILIVTYLFCFMIIVVTILSWLIYVYVFKRNQHKKYIK